MNFNSEIFWLSLTISVYYFSLRIYNHFKSPLLNPVLVSITILIIFLKIGNFQVSDYLKGVSVISFFLGPSVVALGYMLYQQWEEIRKNMRAILWSVALASLAGILSVVLVAFLLGANSSLIASLAPKSVTAPIAIGVAAKTKGIPSLTAAIVIAVGVFGAVVSPTFLKTIGIKNNFAKGLAMGTAAHGIGTARAVEEGEMAGTAAALSIGLMGIFTVLFIFLIHLFFADWESAIKSFDQLL